LNRSKRRRDKSHDGRGFHERVLRFLRSVLFDPPPSGCVIEDTQALAAMATPPKVDAQNEVPNSTGAGCGKHTASVNESLADNRRTIDAVAPTP